MSLFLKWIEGTLPIPGTDIAGRWDSYYGFLVAISFVFFTLVVGTMAYFAYRYRYREGTRSNPIRGHHALEVVWTVIPTILLMIIFAWGWSVYKEMISAPGNSYEVRVLGKQWLWQFQYADGRSTIGDLFVPARRPVKLVMTATDVIHSFFVPNFRIKQDVVPGMYTTVWFETTAPGVHQIYCTEYCGTNHSSMLGRLVALDEAQWKRWERGHAFEVGDDGKVYPKGSAPAEVGSGGTVSWVDRGKKVFSAKGCLACHSVEGQSGVGPTLKGVFGKEREFMDGAKVTADENYLRESILNPQAKVVKNFGPVMPVFQGLVGEDEMTALISYIKSLQ